jgi:succinate dehydrogenase / fumarate reductase cytochrome b subunit
MIAFVFIMWHVFHLHGWFHFESWQEGVAKLGGANFKPYNAASTLGAAMSGIVVQLLYGIGVLSCVFHLANGIWTMGVTWGVWISPQAQKRADKVCTAFGVLLAVIGMSALWGAISVDESESQKVEQKMLEAKLASGEITAQQIHHKAAEQAEH